MDCLKKKVKLKDRYCLKVNFDTNGTLDQQALDAFFEFKERFGFKTNKLTLMFLLFVLSGTNPMEKMIGEMKHSKKELDEESEVVLDQMQSDVKEDDELNRLLNGEYDTDLQDLMGDE